MKIYDHQHQDIRKENGKQFGDLPEFMDFEYFKKNVWGKCFCFGKFGQISFKTRKCEDGCKRIDQFHDHSLGKTKKWRSLGYDVLMRETDFLYWQKKFFTKENSMKLPYSKDNYFFAYKSGKQFRKRKTHRNSECKIIEKFAKFRGLFLC